MAVDLVRPSTTTGARARIWPTSWPWQAQILLLGAIWGGSFPFIKVADRSFAPFDIAGGRVALAAVTVTLVLAATGGHLPRGRTRWAHLAVAGLFMNVLPFTVIAWAELRISAIAAGILNATTPLFTLPFAFLLVPSERMTKSRIVGLIIGFLGVIVVLGAWHGLPNGQILGYLASLAGALSYGIGLPYTRRFVTTDNESVTSLAAGQLICATVEMAVISPAFLRVPLQVSGESLASLIALGVLCTGIAYMLSYSIVGVAGATSTSLVTFLIPIFATIFGAALLSERLSWYEPAGAVVVLAGVALVQGMRIRPRRASRALWEATRRHAVPARPICEETPGG
ncbi:MAG: DMT family transporter [Acidimicrobiales bacterium]